MVNGVRMEIGLHAQQPVEMGYQQDRHASLCQEKNCSSAVQPESWLSGQDCTEIYIYTQSGLCGDGLNTKGRRRKGRK